MLDCFNIVLSIFLHVSAKVNAIKSAITDKFVRLSRHICVEKLLQSSDQSDEIMRRGWRAVREFVCPFVQ
jgi:hypothetical protein